MVDAFQPPEPADQQGISLDVLTQAYAEALSGQLPATRSEEAGAEDPAAGQLGSQEAELLEGLPLPVDGGAGEDGLTVDDPVGVSPTTVLETMLFVGSMDNQPLEPARAAGPMGDSPGDVVGMVEDSTPSTPPMAALTKVFTKGRATACAAGRSILCGTSSTAAFASPAFPGGHRHLGHRGVSPAAHGRPGQPVARGRAERPSPHATRPPATSQG